MIQVRYPCDLSHGSTAFLENILQRVGLDTLKLPFEGGLFQGLGEVTSHPRTERNAVYDRRLLGWLRLGL